MTNKNTKSQRKIFLFRQKTKYPIVQSFTITNTTYTFLSSSMVYTRVLFFKFRTIFVVFSIDNFNRLRYLVSQKSFLDRTLDIYSTNPLQMMAQNFLQFRVRNVSRVEIQTVMICLQKSYLLQ